MNECLVDLRDIQCRFNSWMSSVYVRLYYHVYICVCPTLAISTCSHVTRTLTHTMSRRNYSSANVRVTVSQNQSTRLTDRPCVCTSRQTDLTSYYEYTFKRHSFTSDVGDELTQLEGFLKADIFCTRSRLKVLMLTKCNEDWIWTTNIVSLICFYCALSLTFLHVMRLYNKITVVN